ncbi:MAG: TonB-dependent receptor [Acidobacteria bacterium]|nr:TonB-dependent receptor [Acidobacteriota bacterium]
MYQAMRVLLSRLTLLFVTLGFGFHLLVMAQGGATSSGLAGVVADEQGGAIAGVTVKARNVETNLIRETTTDDTGSYLLTQLTPGTYEVTVSADGFTTQSSKLELTLGTNLKLDFSMQIGSTSEIIEVTTNTVIEEAKTENSTNIDTQRIQSLPINKRSFLDFSLTSPRVTADRVPAQGAAATSGLSFNGQNGRVNNITIDGLDNNDLGTGSVRSTFSQDAIQEFQVVSDSYSAEFGRALGGVVNIVTKGGGNDIHANLFGLVRNDSISARDVFAPFEPEYRQYQFGSVLSGPIKKDQAFYFLSFERLTIAQNNFVTISDDSIKALNRNGFTTDRNGPVPFSIGNTTILARSDLRVNDRDTLWVRYNYGGAYSGSFEPFGALIAESGASLQRLDDNTIAANNTYVGTKLGLVNETRFIYTRRDQAVDPFNQGPQIRVVGPEGLFQAGRSTFSPQPRDLRVYQFVDTVTLTKGRYTGKFGFDVNYYNTPNLKTSVPVFGGGFGLFNPIDFSALTGIPNLPSFTGLQAFDPGSRTPAQQAFLQVASQQLPVLVPGFPVLPLAQLSLPTAYIQGFGEPRIQVDATQLSAFAQNDFKIKPNFTLKLGVRYDRNTLRFMPENSGNFAPRIAIAFRPNKLPKLSIRASYGVFFASTVTGPAFVIGRSVTNQLQQLFLPFPFSIIPFTQPNRRFEESVNIPAGVNFVPQLNRRFTYDDDVVNSYTQQVSLGFDYIIGNNTVVSAGYNYVRGIKLLSQRDINPIVRPVANPIDSALNGRVDPTNGTNFQFESSFDSYFHGLTLSVNRRLANNFSVFLNYTFSKSIDNFIDLRSDLSEINNSLNIRQERGLSLQDVRSRFVASGTVDFSFVKNPLTKDLQLSTIMTLNTGRPYNILAGQDLNFDGDQPAGDRPLSLARNAGVSPGFANVDLRLTRSLVIKDRYKVQLVGEVFNLFNRVNISEINRVFPRQADGSFGLPTQDNGRFIAPKERFLNAFAPRQFQLGFRFNF